MVALIRSTPNRQGLFDPRTTRFAIKMSGFAQAVSIWYDAARGEAEPLVKSLRGDREREALLDAPAAAVKDRYRR